MLLLALLFVLAALGLLVVALAISTMVWAWGSVAASVVATVLLIADWWQRRHAVDAAQDDPSVVEAPEPQARPTATEPTPETPVAGTAEAADPADNTEDADKVDGVVKAEPVSTVRDEFDEFDEDESSDALDREAEPAEEDTDAADILVVSDLVAEVVVLDERPRYHLAGCRWVGARSTLPLPVSEARQLGFSPCAVCTPDAVLAARQRQPRRQTRRQTSS